MFEQRSQIQHRGYRPCVLQGNKPGVLNNFEFNIRKFQRQNYWKFNGKFVSDKSDDQYCDYHRGPLFHQQWLSPSGSKYKYQNGYKRLIWICYISIFQGVTSHQQHLNQNVGRSKTKTIENEKYSKPKRSNKEAKSSTEDIDHVHYKERHLVFNTILN